MNKAFELSWPSFFSTCTTAILFPAEREKNLRPQHSVRPGFGICLLSLNPQWQPQQLELGASPVGFLSSSPSLQRLARRDTGQILPLRWPRHILQPGEQEEVVSLGWFWNCRPCPKPRFLVLGCDSWQRNSSWPGMTFLSALFREGIFPLPEAKWSTNWWIDCTGES